MYAYVFNYFAYMFISMFFNTLESRMKFIAFSHKLLDCLKRYIFSILLLQQTWFGIQLILILVFELKAIKGRENTINIFINSTLINYNIIAFLHQLKLLFLQDRIILFECIGHFSP